MFENLRNAMIEMQEQEALQIAQTLLDEDANPLEILNACTMAMQTVGRRFEEGIYFLPELMLAGEMLKQISDKVKPKIDGRQASRKASKVLIGTVQGDIHDIGKDIVVFLLDVNGFDVHDIGIDAPPVKFVEAIRTFQPQVVGLSGLLTLAYDSMKETVAAIEEAGLRDQVKIIIGGGQMNDKISTYAGADACAGDALDGLNRIREWTGEH